MNEYGLGLYRIRAGSLIITRPRSAAVCKWTPVRIHFTDPFRVLWYVRYESYAESFCSGKSLYILSSHLISTQVHTESAHYKHNETPQQITVCCSLNTDAYHNNNSKEQMQFTLTELQPSVLCLLLKMQTEQKHVQFRLSSLFPVTGNLPIYWSLWEMTHFCSQPPAGLGGWPAPEAAAWSLSNHIP